MPPCDMKAETAIAAVDYFLERYSSIEQISFFGGEPLLVPKVIERVCEYVTRKCPERSTSFSIVTNASKLNDEVVNLLEKYHIAVIASIDGNKEINDMQRRYADGSGTYDDVDSKLLNLRGRLALSIEATYTSNHERLGITRDELTSELSERYGTSRVVVNDMTAVPSAGQAICCCPSTSGFKEGIVSFFENGCKTYNDAICDLITCFVKGNGSPLFCSAGVSRFAVDMAGDIYPCHLFVGDEEYKLGNVLDSKDISLFAPRTKNQQSCSSCACRPFCNCCVHELVNGCSDPCSQVKEGVEYFLDEMLEIFITDNKKYNDIVDGALMYMQENALGRSPSMPDARPASQKEATR